MYQLMKMAATSLDQYLYYKDDPENRYESFLSYLRKEPYESRPADIGTTFHAAMEYFVKEANRSHAPELAIPNKFKQTKPSWIKSKAVSGPVTFNIKEGVDFELPVLGAKTEVWGSLNLPEIGVQIRGRTDALLKNKVVDFKTSATNFGPTTITRWMDAMQWRIYLLMFKCNEFEYCWFRVKDHGEPDNIVDVIQYETMKMYSYPDMRADVIETALELRKFRAAHGFM